MMRKLKIYLDTSVINFIFADDAPQFQVVTTEFFKKYFNEYEVFISNVVLFEIDKTKNAKRKKELLYIVHTYPFQVLQGEADDDVEYLASLYLAENIIPATKKEDALHIAIATVYEMDILLSWNFKHLANVKKQIMINTINEREGYLKKLHLLNPMEVEYDKEK